MSIPQARVAAGTALGQVDVPGHQGNEMNRPDLRVGHGLGHLLDPEVVVQQVPRGRCADRPLVLKSWPKSHALKSWPRS